MMLLRCLWQLLSKGVTGQIGDVVCDRSGQNGDVKMFVTGLGKMVM